MIKLHVDRNAGHPWDGRPGFDRMEIDADAQGELDDAIVRAEAKHWQIWISAHRDRAGKPTAVFYKPCRAD